MGKGAKLMVAIFGFVFILSSSIAFLGYKALNYGVGRHNTHDTNSVCVEPMDPNAGPQGMQSDNPDFGGGPNLHSNTRQSPNPLWFRYYRLLFPSESDPSMILYQSHFMLYIAIYSASLMILIIFGHNTTEEDPSACNQA